MEPNGQELNIKKYALNGGIQYLESGLNMVKQMISDAKTEEELERARVYLYYIVDGSKQRIDKLYINKETKTK